MFYHNNYDIKYYPMDKVVFISFSPGQSCTFRLPRRVLCPLLSCLPVTILGGEKGDSRRLRTNPPSFLPLVKSLRESLADALETELASTRLDQHLKLNTFRVPFTNLSAGNYMLIRIFTFS